MRSLKAQCSPVDLYGVLFQTGIVEAHSGKAQEVASASVAASDDIICTIDECPPLLDCKEVTAKCVSLEKAFYKPYQHTKLVFALQVITPERYAGAILKMFVPTKSESEKLRVASKLFKTVNVAVGKLKPRQRISKKMFLGKVFRCRLRSVEKLGAVYTIVDHLLEKVDL